MILRDALAYLAAVAIAAIVMVLGTWIIEPTASGASGLIEISVMIAIVSVVTFCSSLPLSLVLIAVGEWRRFGHTYFVLAIAIAILLSFGALVLISPIGSWLARQFVSVGVGGFAGGIAFAAMRKLLIDRLYCSPTSPAPSGS